MEMSNRTNNVAPNLLRERNQLHSSMHPSMLFIRGGVLLKHHLHPSSRTHTTLTCSHRPYTHQLQGSPPTTEGVEISGAGGGYKASKHQIRVNVPSLGSNLFRGGTLFEGLEGSKISIYYRNSLLSRQHPASKMKHKNTRLCSPLCHPIPPSQGTKCCPLFS